ncbi:MAG TPA: fluoride efflux transporter CrcB [Allocoleopsis sp.]
MLQNPEIRAIIAISLGAIAGALARYYLTLFFQQLLGDNFPSGTFFINVTGCLLIGFFATVAPVNNISGEIRLLFQTGFLGAYTTFSTYSLETLNLIKTEKYVLATLYGAGSAIIGIISVQLGVLIGKNIS